MVQQITAVLQMCVEEAVQAVNNMNDDKSLEKIIMNAKNSVFNKVAAYFLAFTSAIYISDICNAETRLIKGKSLEIQAFENENMVSSTVSDDWTAFEETINGVHKVSYHFNNDPNIGEMINVDNAKDPDLDGDYLVFTSPQGVHLYHLPNKFLQTIYPAFGGKVCIIIYRR